MNILVIGEYYSSNLGDGVICQIVVALLKQRHPNSNIDVVDISNEVDYKDKRRVRTKYYEFQRKIDYYFRYRFFKKTQYRENKYRFMHKKAYIKKMCRGNYDLAIFAGGQLFMDYFVFPIYYYVKYLSKRNIPIIFNACGSGPIHDKKLIRMMKKALNNEKIKSISTRDDLQKLQALYFDAYGSQIQKTFDPALCTEEVYDITEIQTDKIGLGVIYCKNITEEENLSIWRNIIRELEKRKLKWEIFCNGSPEDFAFGNRLLTYLGYSEKERMSHIAQRPQRPQELVDTISRYQKIISFRLHSHIIAYSLNIPSIALIWDEKLKFFFKKINHEERCLNALTSSKKVVDLLIEIEYEKEDSELKEVQKGYLKELLYTNIEL